MSGGTPGAGRLAALAGAALAAALSSCGGNDDSPANAEATPKATVVMADGAYVPARVRIAAGGRVTFVNRGVDASTAQTTGTGSFDYDREEHARRGVFDLHTFQQGEAESVELHKPGTYVYYSSLDDDMRGVIEVVAARDGSSGARPQPAAVKPVLTRQPARTFAPLIRLHPKERFFPIAADRFIQRSSLKWRNGDCIGLDDIATGRIADRKTAAPVPRLDPARLGGSRPPYRQRRLDRECKRRVGRAYLSTDRTRPYDGSPRAAGLGAGEGFYLDVLTDSFDGDPPLERQGARRVLGDVPAYYERQRVTIDGHRGVQIVYWLLSARSESHGARGSSFAFHEGDWQRIHVLLRDRGANRWTPVGVGFVSQPDGTVRNVPWKDVERTGLHPIVYSALESHVPYADSGAHSRRVPSEGRSVTVQDETATCDGCPTWRTWERLRPVRREPWYGFGGGWGFAYQASETSGPLGPGRRGR